MSRLELRFTAAARSHLLEADTWWQTDRPAAPDQIFIELLDAVDRLRSMPGLGTRYLSEALPDVRRHLLGRTRFHMYYVVRGDDLVVVAVLGGQRRSGPPLEQTR